MNDLSLVKYVAKLPSGSRIVNEYCNLIEEIEQLKRDKEVLTQTYNKLFDTYQGLEGSQGKRDIEQQAKGIREATEAYAEYDGGESRTTQFFHKHADNLLDSANKQRS